VCRDAATTFDWGTLPNVVAAMAAVVAVLFALLTVLETKAMRREERLARLPELVADLAHALGGALNHTFRPGGDPRWTQAHAARERLRAALEATSDGLPACRALLVSPLFPASDDERTALPFTDVDAAVSAAIDELVPLLHRARMSWWRRRRAG